jgi:hypothetical protein
MFNEYVVSMYPTKFDVRLFRVVALQVFVSPHKNVFELLQQFNKLGTGNRFQINANFNLVQDFFKTQVDIG